ncbi:DUF4209 domain-containing protein [Flavobacterium sp. UBA7663]|uniref:DUF4209 domain-containing protein n=1 Tax=Flavobacterium sp. UBA7663 TaxID=1946557 RepID=UPI0025BC8B58|nr:DUF4209 domain-containing protein [Flavobacterium sp. UBA7663]
MEFQSLDEYYDYLEKDTNFQYLDLNTYKYITALRDKTEDDNTKKLCSYELFFADFSIENGLHVPKFQIGDNAYPSLELFDDNFEYIKTRANKAQNQKYKAKYNHLLWLSPQKHIEFAKNAIESYLLLLQNSSFSVDDNLQCYSFGKYYKNLFVLSQKVNYKKDEIISYFVSLLESEKLNDFTKYSLMEFVVENGKNIDASVKQTFFDYSKNRISNLTDRELESYLNLLVLLSQKLNISTSEFHEKLGDYHISQLENEKNKGFIAHHYYTNALEEYKKANIKEKNEQTAVLLEQAKKTIDLKKVSFELKDEKINEALNQWWDFTKKKIDYVIENGNDKEIYQYLILEQLFPKADVLKEEIRPIMLDLVSTMTFDINKNISKSKTGGINPYYIHINNFSINHIGLVASKGFKSGKFSFESLINYFKNDSWYGQDFTYLDTNNETQGFNWIELLTPALQSFFVQTEIDLKTNSHNPQGYILALDNLVLKFEGLLREFSRMIGAQTIEIKDNGTEERIGFDKLLDNEKLKVLIPEDDIAFFKYLFTSNGMNLRNNVAHCFFTTKNYSSAVMLLLIVALLRLGNYKLETKTNES